MKKTTKRKHRPEPCGNPVERAVARDRQRKAIIEMHSHLTRLGLQCYLTADGEAAPTLLGDLALMLGIGAEIGINRDKHASETRRMHAALRTVVAMGANGGRWQAAQAKVLHEAAALAVAAFEAHSALGVSMMPGAHMLATDVRSGTVRMDAVLGVEIYKEREAA